MQKPKILVDFDKTISPIHGFTEPPVPEALRALIILATKYHISIYSCRANTQVCQESDYIHLISYLTNYGIPYDDIITDKPVYSALIDDRAFNPTVTSWDDIVNELLGQS